jgi:hypothetical protein
MTEFHSTMPDQRERDMPAVSGWAFGGIGFAASLLTLIGTFQIFAGLTAIFNDNFFVATRNYTFDLDTTAWGWVHLIVGVLIVATGVGLFGRRTWAGVTAIFLAMLSALTQFLFIPYYPFWAITLIALDVWVIWALTRPGAIET